MEIFEIFRSSLENISNREGVFDNDYLIWPFAEGSSYYQETPKDCIVFGEMRVDGVHYCYFHKKTAEFPKGLVVMISPSDVDSVYIIAKSFEEYLAKMCGTNVEVIRHQATNSEVDFFNFVKSNFHSDRLFK